MSSLIKNPFSGRMVKSDGDIGKLITQCRKACSGDLTPATKKKSAGKKKKSSPKGGKKGSPAAKKSAGKKKGSSSAKKKKKTVRERQIELIMKMLRARGDFKGQTYRDVSAVEKHFEGQSDYDINDEYWVILDQLPFAGLKRSPFMDKTYGRALYKADWDETAVFDDY